MRYLPVFSSFMLAVLLAWGFSNPQHSSSKHTAEVYVKNSNGAVQYAKVVGQVCESLTCSGQTAQVSTDAKGLAVLSWGSDCDICTVYVNGKAHSVKLRNGGSVTITI